MIQFPRAALVGAASALIGAALALPARSYDLHYRQNGTSFSASELRRIFSNALPPTFRVIEPLPRSAGQWQQRLSDLAARYARLMLVNRSRILSQR